MHTDSCGETINRAIQIYPPAQQSSVASRLLGAVRVIVTGSVGKVGWLVPLALLVVAWRNLRDPEHNGPAGACSAGIHFG